MGVHLHPQCLLHPQLNLQQHLQLLQQLQTPMQELQGPCLIPPNLQCPCPISLTHPCQWVTTHMDISNLPKHRDTPSSSTTSPHSRASRLKVTLNSPHLRATLHSSHLRATFLRDRLILPSSSLLRHTQATLHSQVLQASLSGGRQRREKAFTVDLKTF